MGAKAVFLDRDGVINENVFYADTGETEAPRKREDFKLLPSSLEAMHNLQQAGFSLFLVSNQPNQAKRKASLGDHQDIHNHLMNILSDAGIELVDVFYCFHHPSGIEPLLSGPCECRKPSPYFLFLASKKYNLDIRRSWMVGDRDTDILCGYNAGARTVIISNSKKNSEINADFEVKDLIGAARIITDNKDL